MKKRSAWVIFYGDSFIYDKDVKFNDPEIVTEFYHAAHKYNCKDAVNYAKDYMLENLDLQNSTVYYETAVLYDITDVKTAALKVFHCFISD